MFKGYRDAIDTAEEVEVEINTRFDGLKEAHSISQQKMMEAEAKKMRGGQQLKDYNPTEFANEITRMKYEFDQIEEAEQAELDKAKANLDSSLQELMGYSLPFTEMYKVIGCDVNGNHNHYNYMCRVWFTLVPIKQFNCEPGDPIRIEWVNMWNRGNTDDKDCGITATSLRIGMGHTGLTIPQFTNVSAVTNKDTFYNVDNWGTKSRQKTWWINWVKANRPIPETTHNPSETYFESRDEEMEVEDFEYCGTTYLLDKSTGNLYPYDVESTDVAPVGKKKGSKVIIF